MGRLLGIGNRTEQAGHGNSLHRTDEAFDQQRDDLLTNLFGVVRAQLKSPVAAVREAAKALDKGLGVYAGIQNKAVDAETAEVRGMLKDLEHFATEVTALGLTPVTTQLKTVNDEFQKVYNTRQEKAVDPEDAGIE